MTDNTNDNYKGPKYCSKCGRELLITKYDKDTYDQWTGSREIGFKTICPTGTCGHHGVEHDYEHDVLYSSPVIGLFFSKIYCRRCGYEK